MAINYSALVFPVALQENLVDKQGVALSNGTVYFYSNTNRTFFKNVYYQSGTVAPYEYIPLPNPLILSASGTICDVNGADVLPGFYSFSEVDNVTVETYFIQIYDSNMTLVNTLYNFPIVVTGSTPPIEAIETLQNLIMNGRFWRNLGSSTVDLTNKYSLIVAPDQHDGYSTALNGPSGAPSDIGIMTDITFNKNALGTAETVSFGTFPLTTTPPLAPDYLAAPEFFLNHICTAGGGSETLKYYQIPISCHLSTLNSVPIVVTFEAIDNTGSGATNLSLSLFAFQGTGQTSAVPTPFKTGITLSSAWTSYSFKTVTPSTAGNVSPSGPGDDALYLWIGLPGNVPLNISIAVPSIYIGFEAPNTSFSNYDQINSIISSPRTGDVRTSLNSFYSWGWAPMNDGTICNSGAVIAPTGFNFSRQNIDAWPLYSLLWNAFKAYDTGSNFNPICQMYTSGTPPMAAGVVTNYGGSAISDWNALKQLQLTNVMGKVLMGTVPVSALIPLYSSTFTGSGTAITITSTAKLFSGMPVTFTGTSTLTPGVVYYIGVASSTIFGVYTTFLNAISATSPVSVDASGTFIAALTGTGEGEYAHTQLAKELASHNHTIFNSAGASTGGLGVVTTTGTGNSTGLNTPAGSPFNITQPGTFVNLFIKL